MWISADGLRDRCGGIFHTFHHILRVPLHQLLTAAVIDNISIPQQKFLCLIYATILYIWISYLESNFD